MWRAATQQLLTIALALGLAACPPPTGADGGSPPGDAGDEDGGTPPDAGCVPSLVRGVEVTVAETGTARRVCDALVVATATAGGYEETLIVFGGLNDCLYYGLFNRAGTYTVTATRGEDTDDGEVTVTVDSCGQATTETLELRLDPLPVVDAGTEGDGGADAGEEDAGAAADGGGADAGEPDAGGPDDGGANDGGTQPADGGGADAGLDDAGRQDAGLNDAGPQDAGA